MFKIGEFSKLSNITIRMLRHYDEIELLTPRKIDSFTSYRYYSSDQLVIANKIQAYKSIGFSLAIIKDLLKNEDDKTIVNSYFENRKKELSSIQEELNKQIDLIERLNSNMDTVKYNVVEKVFPSRKVASYRDIISSYDQEGTLWNELYKEIGLAGVIPAENPYTTAFFHDMEYKESDVDVEVFSTVSGENKENGKFRVYDFPEIKVASVTFSGSYDQMPAVTGAVAKWFEDNNLKMGQMMNIYHVSPYESQNPADWVTEACFTIV